MKKLLQNLLKYGVPLVIGVGLFYFLYKNVDMDQMRNVLKENVNYWWFVPVIVVSIFSHIFRALRWGLQLKALGINAPFRALVNSIFGTYFVNLVFPRLGEVWRTGYIAKRQDASLSVVFGSMVADRMSDTIMVLLLTVITFFLAQGPFMEFLGTYPEVKAKVVGLATSPVVWGCLVLMVVAMVWLFASKSENALVTKVRGTVKNLWDGFAVVTKMEGKWMFLLYSLLIWGCYFMQLYIATFAFSFTSGLGAVAVLVLFVLSSLGMGIPTNGGLGAWHVAIIFGLSLYGVGQFTPPVFDSNASAFAMLVWGVQTLLLIVLGIYAFASIALDKKEDVIKK